MASTAPGYAYGDAALSTSPVTLEDLDRIKATLLWTDADTAVLRQAGEVLSDQVEAVLDVWYGFVADHAHLMSAFAGADGAPDDRYLERVRARFAEWIRDTCTREHDQAWLDWQHEMGLRHTREKKNRTDGVDSPAGHVELRYLIAFVVPLTATIRPFLRAGGHAEQEVEAMYTAWFKAITLTAVLWAEPYAADW